MHLHFRPLICRLLYSSLSHPTLLQITALSPLTVTLATPSSSLTVSRACLVQSPFRPVRWTRIIICPCKKEGEKREMIWILFLPNPILYLSHFLCILWRLCASSSPQFLEKLANLPNLHGCSCCAYFSSLFYHMRLQPRSAPRWRTLPLALGLLLMFVCS